MKMTNDFLFNPRDIRRSLKLKQEEFWSRIGVTQSGGSRYEAGRRMPNPVRELLRVVYIERIDLARINRSDFDLLEYLKAEQPEMYEGLREQLRSQQRTTPPAALPVAGPLSTASLAAPASETAQDEMDSQP